jgi:hypothetical protein
LEYNMSAREAPGAHDPTLLPADLPVPQDDGAARHLMGMRLPDLALPATSGPAVNLSKLKGRAVIYIYPRTGVPGSMRRRDGTTFPARGVARRNRAAFATTSLN